MSKHKRPNRPSGIPGQHHYRQAAIYRALVEMVSTLFSIVLSFFLLKILTDLDESIPSYMQVGSALAFGSSPSTPPRRSHENDSWTSSDLREPAWSGVVPPFSSDDVNLSPSKRRLGDLPRSTSPFHSLQETRHRQATAAQAAALSHAADSTVIEDTSRTLTDNTLGDRNRGRSVDMEELVRNGSVDVFHQRQTTRNQRPFDGNETTGRGIRSNILGSLDDDFPRNHPVSRTRVQTFDPSFSLEPLQRANSTPPFSGPVPTSSRDLPKSGLNPYPQSRTPQLQSSGHFTASSREDHLSKALRDLSLESRPVDFGIGRNVSNNNPPVNNLGSGYPSGNHKYLFIFNYFRIQTSKSSSI